MVKKFLVFFIFLLALCSSALAEPHLVTIHESFVYNIYDQNLSENYVNTAGTDYVPVGVSYDTAKFFCVTLEVVSDEVVSDDDGMPYIESFNPPSISFDLSGGRYSFWNSYKIESVDNTARTFNIAQARSVVYDENDSLRWGINKSAYVPTNSEGDWIHFVNDAETGLSGVNVTWRYPEYYSSETVSASIPALKTTAQQLADFVPSIEYKMQGISGAGDIKLVGINWKLVKSSDVGTAITLSDDIHFEIVSIFNINSDMDSYNDKIEATIKSGDTASGDVTITTEFRGVPYCTIVRYYIGEDKNTLYQWRFISLNSSQVNAKLNSAYNGGTYSVAARLTDGKSDYTYARYEATDVSSIAMWPPFVDAKYLTDEGTLTIHGGGTFKIIDVDGELVREFNSPDVDITLPLHTRTALGSSYIEFSYMTEGYRKEHWTYVNDSYSTRGTKFVDETGSLNGKTVSWDFTGEASDLSGSGKIYGSKNLAQQFDKATGGFFPYVEIVSNDAGELTAVKYRLVQSGDLNTPYDPGVACEIRIGVNTENGGSWGLSNFVVDPDNYQQNWQEQFKPSGTLTLPNPIKLGVYTAIHVNLTVHKVSFDETTYNNYFTNGEANNPENYTSYVWSFTDEPPMSETHRMTDEDITNVSEDLLAEALGVSGEEFHFTERGNIFDDSATKEAAINYLENDNSEMVGRFKQLYASEPGWYVTKVILPDELYDNIQGASADNLTVYSITETELQEQTASLKNNNNFFNWFITPAFADSTSKTGKLVNLDGSKLDTINSKELLMVSYLNSQGERANMYLGLDKNAEIVPAKEDEKVTYTLSVDVTPTTLSLSKGATSGNTLTAKTAISPDATITPTYQWYSNSANSTTGGSLINGATSATYLAPTTTAGTLYYYVIAKATVGSNDLTATSNVVSVTINASTTPAKEDEKVTYTLSVDVTPTTLSLSKGATSGNTLTAKTTISPDATITPTYQWYSNSANSTMGGTVISGATNATYLAPTTTAGTLYYYVIAKATVGSNDLTATSNVVSVTINAGTTPTESADVTEGITIGDSGAELDQTAVSEKVNELLKTKAQSEITLSDILGSDTAAIKTAIAASGGEFKLPNGVGNLSDLATLATNLGIKTLNITSTTTTLASISGLTGVNLEAINLESNTSVKAVSLVGATITTVTLTKSAVTSLTLGSGTSAANVKNVDANGATALEEVDIKGNTNITTLDIGNTAVTELDAENCTALTTLEVDNSSSNTQGELKNLSVKGCSNLTKLTISKNQLLWLDLSDTKMTRGANGGFSGRNQKRSAPNFKRKLNFFEFLWNLWAASLEGKTDYPRTYNEETSSPDIAPFKTSQIATTVSYTLSDDTTGTAEIDSNGTATLPAGTKSFKYYYNPFPTTAGTGGFTTADTADSSDMDVEITSTPLEEETYPSLGGSGGGCGSGFGIISALVLVLLKKRH
ncbi:MAG: hypothetical protein SPL01_02400 [Synergistales bacterium]|nr:hypothetical protein [Synergistales bacterium]